MAKKKEGFYFYHGWLPMEIRKQLTNEQLGRLFVAIIEYSAHDVERNFSNDKLLQAVWLGIKCNMNMERR